MNTINTALGDGLLQLRPLLASLVKDGRLSGDEAKSIAAKIRSAGDKSHPLVAIASKEPKDPLVGGSKHSMDTLLHWLSGQYGLESQRIDPLKVDVEAVTRVMSHAFAQRHRILAVAVGVEEIVIACAEPNITTWISGLEQAARKPVRRVLASPIDIDRYLEEFYNMSRSVINAKKADAGANLGIANLEQMLEMGSSAEPDANDNHIVNVVDWLLQYAFEQRASDIHMEPRRENGTVRFRIDGVLHSVYELPIQVMRAVVSRIKIIGRMDLAEKRKPQDGRLKTKRQDGGEIELRLSTLPTAFGEKLVMRIFDPEVLVRSFTQLGLMNQDRDRWEAMVKRPHGIVLVTGPTGSGKTTTLYTTLKKLANSEVNVCTIEDPIEMVEASFNQMQVQHNIDLDFAGGLRALMRQDPDIIMVGEIRDLETAEMAIQASLTGHLVLSTLHTNDAPSAVTRMMEIGVPAYLIKATVLGVMAQRLVRILCDHCKLEEDTDANAWAALVAPWSLAMPAKVSVPVGCRECRNTGYAGREGIYEIMTISQAVGDEITKSADIGIIRDSAMSEGMQTLRLNGAHKVIAGDTTIAEVMRVAPPLQLS
jgi:general secretion pathway protein E|tara:strand:- start:1915 stop:3696 length:1782 start_codon:yes stop_codon:yes gene_type:complete